MRNLTSSTIVLFPAGGAAPIVLPPSRAVTTKQMQEMLILKGEMIDVGAGAMDSATLKTPARTKDEAQARSTTQTPTDESPKKAGNKAGGTHRGINENHAQ